MNIAADLGDGEKQFGDFLVQEGILDRSAVCRALTLCENGRRPLYSVLLNLGLVEEPKLASALAECFGLTVLPADDFPDAAIAKERLSAAFLRNAKMLPIDDNGERLLVAVANPLDDHSIRAVRLAAGKPVELAAAEATHLDKAIARLYGEDDHEHEVDLHVSDVPHEQDAETLKGLASEAPIVRLVNGLINDAVTEGASDIHIEPSERGLVVRFRVDGRLVERASLPIGQALAIASRIKIMAKLNIAERRLPQDGRVQTAVRGRHIDLRISTMPTVLGESIVIRILDRESVRLEFDALGISDNNQRLLKSLLERPNGVLLVTGPTGSGKTTTLYAALSMLANPEVNIMTVEDPVEYRLSGVKQIQVNSSIGLDFAHVLRSTLRHDPDIILIGEIRDLETASIAIQSAFTGHLVLATLHTNDAASSITRLLDMGLQNYLLTSSIVGVVAQRLVRKLCPRCKRREIMKPELADRLGLASAAPGEPVYLFRAVGCEHCQNRGYRGRSLIMETMPLSPSLNDQVLKGADAQTLRETARSEGMRTLFEDGLQKVLQGETTLEEVLRAAHDTSIESRDSSSDAN